MLANFNALENRPFWKLKLIMLVMVGVSSSKQCFSNQVGTGSRLYDLDGELMMIFLTEIYFSNNEITIITEEISKMELQ